MEQDTYYSINLFQFIRFDPIKVEPKLLSTEMSFSKVNLFDNQGLSDDRYFQTWDDKGGIIEVLRIDRLNAEVNNNIVD